MGKKELSERKVMLIFINIVITCVASSMLATSLTTALPPIIKDLNIPVTTGQWLTSGYSLVMAIVMPLSAFMINRFPTKRLYCSAIFTFIVGVFICSISVNFEMMLLGRCIQAMGNGMLISMAQVVVLTIFPPEKKGAAMGWYGLSIGAAPIIAPTIAGIMVDRMSWRMIFVIPMIIMTISFIYSLIIFDNVLETVNRKFDITSFIMSAFAFGGVTLGIGNLGTSGLLSVKSGGFLLIGLVFAAVFAKRQLRIDEPFLELRILKNKKYRTSVFGSMLLYFILMGSTLLIPLYIQETRGLSATTSALVTLPGALANAVFSPFAGKLYDKFGMKILFRAGAFCLVVCNIGMYFVGLNTPISIAAVLNVVRMTALGLLLMPLVTWGAENVSSELTPHATAIITSLRTTSGAIGSAVFVSIMTVVSENSVKTYGSGASMHGVNIAFLMMGLASVVMLLIAWDGTKNEKKRRITAEECN